jgi:radical SAM superfamily enzyme YgiQ (UPF0313 family)
MNILLVYPRSPGVFWSMGHIMKFIGKKAVYPPLSLLTVAAMLPEQWQKKLVDLSVQELHETDLEWADFVFLTGMYVHRDSMREIVARCNEAGVKVVAGGPYVTHGYEMFPGVDHFVLNEAEITLPLFLDDLERGCPEPIYTTTELANTHETPMPLWELADMNLYVEGLIQYSRGCPYQCDFCDVTALFGRLPRTKTADQIITELNSMGDLNRFRSIFFADDNLIGNKKLLKSELLPALIEWRQQSNIKIPFRTQVTINIADDPELMDLMIQAGFKGIFIGIETPDEESLLNCNKKQNTRRDLIENVKLLQQTGFDVYAGFIVGFDSDTADIFQKQIDFIQDSGIVVALVNILKAPPGTDLYDRMVREGRLHEVDLDGREGDADFVSIMGDEVLYRGYKRVVKYIYAPKNLYERTRNFLRNHETHGPMILSSRALVNDVWTYFKTLYYLGIQDSGRMYYWKLLVWTLLNRPSLFPVAVELWIITYHYRKIYEDDAAFMEMGSDRAEPQVAVEQKTFAASL